MRRLPRTTLSEEAYAALLDAIVTGELAPGRAAARPGPGGAPRHQPHAGPRGASPPRRRGARRGGPPQLVIRVAPIDIERAAHAFPVVAALQALATRLGVPGLTRAGLDGDARPRPRARASPPRAGEIPAAIAADDAFHAVLLDAAGNRELRRALERAGRRSGGLDLVHFRALSREEPAGGDVHAAILDACERGAAGEAAALVEATFLELGEAVAELLRQRPAAHEAGRRRSRGARALPRLPRDRGARRRRAQRAARTPPPTRCCATRSGPPPTPVTPTSSPGARRSPPPASRPSATRAPRQPSRAARRTRRGCRGSPPRRPLQRDLGAPRTARRRRGPRRAARRRHAALRHGRGALRRPRRQRRARAAVSGEPVWADDAGVTCRRWSWRQGERTGSRRTPRGRSSCWRPSRPHPPAALRAAADDLAAHLRAWWPRAVVEDSTLP